MGAIHHVFTSGILRNAFLTTEQTFAVGTTVVGLPWLPLAVTNAETSLWGREGAVLRIMLILHSRNGFRAIGAG